MKKSNLYIEKIYRDHPIACWALDDDITFRQLLSQSSLNWSISGGSFDYSSTKNQVPIISNGMFEKISITGDATITYNLDLSTINYDPSRGELCFSAWIYHPSVLITKYEIGIVDHTDETEYFTEYVFVNDRWYHIFDTFPVSIINNQCELFIRLYSDGSESIYLNAPSLGQDAEEYCSYSIGYFASELQVELTADEYGRSTENNGAYMLNEYSNISVREGGIPIAFGSYQSLAMIPNSFGAGMPIKLPGNGFLHENGKHNNYTLEFWTRLSNKSSTPVRIVGAVDSTDGIYVEECFISIYLGPYTQSYFVGKWNRPMLIHFEYSPTMAMLFVNGERVISIDIDIEKIPFSSGNDSIGFYASDKIYPYEIDSIALYPYTMPTETAKKHFVFGQGVQEFDFSNDKFIKRTVQIDFPYSQYSNNVIYPDTTKWRSGYSVNFDTSSTYLKPSVYPLPEVIAEKDGVIINSDLWLLDNYNYNTSNSDVYPYVIMKPTVEYDNASIYFRTLDLLGNKVESVIGLFKSPAAPVANQTVVSFDNKQSGQSLKAILNNTTLKYAFFGSDGIQIGADLYTETVAASEYFNVGIKFLDFSRNFYSQIGIFFADQNKISISIGGSGTSTFAGRVFSFTFMEPFMHQRDFENPAKFTNGILPASNGQDLLTYIGSYTSSVLSSNTSLIFDCSTSGYWEDNIPLSMLGKNVASSTGTIYDLDIVQFNIDSQYKDVFLDTADMVPYGIFELIINNLFDTYGDVSAYYNTYDEMYQNVAEIYESFRVDAGVRCYVTLQSYSEMGAKPYSDFVNTVPSPDNNVITFNTLTLDNTKYEVYDNNVLIIPKEIDFNEYYLCIHIETKIKGSITKSITIKRMELTSLAYNDGVPTQLGTKYSVPIFPFSEAVV